MKQRDDFSLVILVCLVAHLWSHADGAESIGFDACHGVFADKFIPHQQSKKAEVCRAQRLAVSYDNIMINPAWAAVHVTPAQVREHIPGRLPFYEDPDLEASGVTQAAVNADVYGTTWNRGHLCPSSILSSTTQGKNATFTMANIAPQYAKFNQQTWATLERLVENWIDKNSTALYIITGVAYEDRSDPTRDDGVAIPEYYFKVVCDLDGGESAGFIGINNATTGRSCLSYHEVAEVEELYGGQLLPATCNTDAVHPSYWWGEVDENFIAHRRA